MKSNLEKAMEITKELCPSLLEEKAMSVACVFMNNPSFTSAVVSDKSVYSSYDLCHDIVGMLGKDEFFCPRIN
tara:strand:+ start:17 stop:235 length:219 start_codon:yes stop_codon:yes gene_type:complete